ncbi:MAG: hypothetical protein V4556_08400 [Bacteroidota bacterium]
MIKRFFNNIICVLLLAIVVNQHSFAQFEEGRKEELAVKLAGASIKKPLTSDPAGTGVLVTSYSSTPNEISKKTQHVIAFKINELDNIYMQSSFKATIKLNIKTWTHLSDATPNDLPQKTLVVDFNINAATKYDVLSYFTIDNVEKVEVTVADDVLIENATGWNPLLVLILENNLNTTRYYELSSNNSILSPIYQPHVFSTDALEVKWGWGTLSSDPGHNLSQLEWAWIPQDLENFYKTSGEIDEGKVFNNNSTRVDITYPQTNYSIPLLYDGDGVLYYRVRAGQRKNSGALITASEWGGMQQYSYGGHENDVNWQSNITFAEDGKSKAVIQYFDGSLRGRQTVTKDNSTINKDESKGNTVVAETIYDFQGRPTIQILPTPTVDNKIKFFRNFNSFDNQAKILFGSDINNEAHYYFENPANVFDLTLDALKCSKTEKLDIRRGNGKYYSPNNDWLTETYAEEKAKFIPDANGYAYTETRFMDDATERVQAQGGVGDAHQIGSGHETKYFYGKPNQEELDALFGAEVGDANHYSKNMVQDANGQMSVSYVDMHGRTVATALAGNAPAVMDDISKNTVYYPATDQLKNDIITSTNNIVNGNSIEAVNSILVSATTNYDFHYSLTPQIYSALSCTSDPINEPVCFDCKYNLDISIKSDDCGGEPIVLHYNNLQIVPANQACSTSAGFVEDNTTGNTPVYTFHFTQELKPGAYTIRKTLSINQNALDARKQIALDNFLCQSQENLEIEILAQLKLKTGCDQPNPEAYKCQQCSTALGTETEYRARYHSIFPLGNVSDQEIDAQYKIDKANCESLCNTTGSTANSDMNSLALIRWQMLDHMSPEGQYTDRSVNPTDLSAKYNIFVETYQGSSTSRPFYKNPNNPENITGNQLFYFNDYNLPEENMNAETLAAISPDDFSEQFASSWANSLIMRHPEYSKLKYAETNLVNAYKWLDDVTACEKYEDAVAQHYLDPVHFDPYFIGVGSADVGGLNTFLTVNGATPSAFTVANGAVICKMASDDQREACMANSNIEAHKISDQSTAWSVADKDEFWDAFKGAYLSYRNEVILKHINSRAGVLPRAEMDQLIIEGKQLAFAVSQDLASQNASGTEQGNAGTATLWALANSGTATQAEIEAAAQNVINNNTPADKCAAFKPYWKSRLLECEYIKDLLNDDANTSQITVINNTINNILNQMVEVCHHSMDADHPIGASNTNPANVISPDNFETIIKTAFANANIPAPAANGNYFCNPYTIDNPGPYDGFQVPIAINNSNKLDDCACTRFNELKQEAIATGNTNYNPTTITGFNLFLKEIYEESPISEVLWVGLQQCGTCPTGTNSTATCNINTLPGIGCEYGSDKVRLNSDGNNGFGNPTVPITVNQYGDYFIGDAFTINWASKISSNSIQMNYSTTGENCNARLNVYDIIGNIIYTASINCTSGSIQDYIIPTINPDIEYFFELSLDTDEYDGSYTDHDKYIKHYSPALCSTNSTASINKFTTLDGVNLNYNSFIDQGNDQCIKINGVSRNTQNNLVLNYKTCSSNTSECYLDVYNMSGDLVRSGNINATDGDLENYTITQITNCNAYYLYLYEYTGSNISNKHLLYVPACNETINNDCFTEASFDMYHGDLSQGEMYSDGCGEVVKYQGPSIDAIHLDYYDIPENSDVNVKVYDLCGNKVDEVTFNENYNTLIEEGDVSIELSFPYLDLCKTYKFVVTVTPDESNCSSFTLPPLYYFAPTNVECSRYNKTCNSTTCRPNRDAFVRYYTNIHPENGIFANGCGSVQFEEDRPDNINAGIQVGVNSGNYQKLEIRVFDLCGNPVDYVTVNRADVLEYDNSIIFTKLNPNKGYKFIIIEEPDGYPNCGRIMYPPLYYTPFKCEEVCNNVGVFQPLPGSFDPQTSCSQCMACPLFDNPTCNTNTLEGISNQNGSNTTSYITANPDFPELNVNINQYGDYFKGTSLGINSLLAMSSNSIKMNYYTNDEECHTRLNVYNTAGSIVYTNSINCTSTENDDFTITGIDPTAEYFFELSFDPSEYENQEADHDRYIKHYYPALCTTNSTTTINKFTTLNSVELKVNDFVNDGGGSCVKINTTSRNVANNIVLNYKTCSSVTSECYLDVYDMNGNLLRSGNITATNSVDANYTVTQITDCNAYYLYLYEYTGANVTDKHLLYVPPCNETINNACFAETYFEIIDRSLNDGEFYSNGCGEVLTHEGTAINGLVCFNYGSSLPENSEITLKVYDLCGNKLDEVVFNENDNDVNNEILFPYLDRCKTYKFVATVKPSNYPACAKYTLPPLYYFAENGVACSPYNKTCNSNNCIIHKGLSVNYYNQAVDESGILANGCGNVEYVQNPPSTIGGVIALQCGTSPSGGEAEYKKLYISVYDLCGNKVDQLVIDAENIVDYSHMINFTKLNPNKGYKFVVIEDPLGYPACGKIMYPPIYYTPSTSGYSGQPTCSILEPQSTSPQITNISFADESVNDILVEYNLQGSYDRYSLKVFLTADPSTTLRTYTLATNSSEKHVDLAPCGGVYTFEIKGENITTDFVQVGGVPVPVVSIDCHNENSYSFSCEQQCTPHQTGPINAPIPGSSIMLTDVVPISQVFNCNYKKPCISCTQLTTYIEEFRDLYPVFDAVPYIEGNITADQIKQNNLLARFINYRTGLGVNAVTYVQAYKNCNSSTPPSNAVCAFVKPANDPSGYYVTDDSDPCESVILDAKFQAQFIFNLRKQELIEQFEKNYKAKCLEAKFNEQFYATYKPSEYHYTLYYYNQAGNLIKTLPPAAVKPNYGATYFAQVKYDRDHPQVPASAISLHNKKLATHYAYNTLNQVVEQSTPDGGVGRFWYDKLGRLVVSQNAQQFEDDYYSYTLYDALGRIIEVGRIFKDDNAPVMTQLISQNADPEDPNGLNAWLNPSPDYYAKEQITHTVYDEPNVALCSSNPALQVLCQQNLRNRVSYTYVKSDENNDSWDAATIYSYDIHGNVNILVQDFATTMGDVNCGSTPSGNRFKKMNYYYDLVSGKINSVAYQAGKPDQFYHRYTYDAENKITAVETSTDKVYWEQEATYDYYRHGPLYRTELGKNKVQGIDYAYTIQGWLKGVNSSSMYNGQFDMGKDGYLEESNNHSDIARDAYGFNLNYFNTTSSAQTYTDYKPISTTSAYAFAQLPSNFAGAAGTGTGEHAGLGGSLFNGNISSMLVNLPVGVKGAGGTFSTEVGTGNALLYAYRYDQLNRLKTLQAYNGINQSANSISPQALVNDQYKEDLTYDPNGNIKTLKRNGDAARIGMDNLDYQYNTASGVLQNNQLNHVLDGAANASPADQSKYNDIKTGQTNDNYVYDKIGNLIHDDKEDINVIEWTVYGKIARIAKKDNTQIFYTYDASGNRISKIIDPPSGSNVATYYVRDASGNVMAVYTKTGTDILSQSEVHMYGSSRLGIYNRNIDIQNCSNTPQEITNFTRGNKFFELTNHLGNVLVTITDRKLLRTLQDGTSNTGCETGSANDILNVPFRNTAIQTYVANTEINFIYETDGSAVTQHFESASGENYEAYIDPSLQDCIPYAVNAERPDGSYFIADVVSSNDYYSLGLQMSGRSYTSGNEYRYGFNGQEKSEEIAGGLTTAMFWEYDSRIGRRWNVDPKPEISLSPYNCFGSNPIFYSDYLGDKIKGANTTSANRAVSEIQGTFKGDKAKKLRELFKLSSDNLTMADISEKDFKNAVAGLSKDVQQLAYAYMNAINSKSSTQTVEMVNMNESLSAKGKSATGFTSVASLDVGTGGGRTVTESNSKNSYIVIVMNSQTPTQDNITSSTSGYSPIISSAQELLAHELLGHGVGYAKGRTSTYHHDDAVQMTNLYRRTQGMNAYRNGAGHGSLVILSNATQAPSYAQIPANMQNQIIAIENAQKQAEKQAAEEAIKQSFIQLKNTQDLNKKHNPDRLVNSSGPRIVQPMGGL